jgi:hypothetical protein
MKTILIILVLLAVAAGGIYIATKFFGKFKDEDKDGIPDVIEDKVEEIKVKATKTVNTFKTRAKRVKEELGDVSDTLRDVVEQSKDVVTAAKGGARKGRKPATKTTPVKRTTKPAPKNTSVNTKPRTSKQK